MGQDQGAPPVRVVVSEFPPATGWDTVTQMARLLAHCLNAELVTVPHGLSSSRRAKVLSLLPRRQGIDVTVVVAPQPVHLNAILQARHWTRGSRIVAGWVIDAFWTDRIPRLARAGTHLDHVFVTDDEVVDEWAGATGLPTQWIPFGTDALDRGSAQPDREVDVLRVGRQPADWDDDDAVRVRLSALGLTAAGRTPHVPSVEGNQRALHAAMAGAKFTLSFGNRANPGAYTHPHREYLTGRWLDALANGAVVAGAAPDCAATRRLLWPGATLELGGVDAAGGSQRLVEAVNAWSPLVARTNHRMALERLDWRWRFAELAAALGLESPTLTRELARLEAAVRAQGQ